MRSLKRLFARVRNQVNRRDSKLKRQFRRMMLEQIEPRRLMAIAADDSYSTPMDTSVWLDPLGNDTYADGPNFNVTGGPYNGWLDGSLNYTPNSGFTGTDYFTYEISDWEGSSWATVTIEVTSGNVDAQDDSYQTPVSAQLDVGAPGVLGNDNNDPQNWTLWASQDSGPSNASYFSLSSDGSFTYVPYQGFQGYDSFTYTANGSTSDTATVTILVDTAPSANDDAYETNMNTPLVIGAPGVRQNDSDPDPNDSLTASFNNPTFGSVSGNSDGSFTYTPPQDFNGTDSFTYWVSDSYGIESNLATVVITVGTVNTPPTLDAISPASINEDASTQTVGLAGITAGGSESQSLRVTATSDLTSLIPHPTVSYTSPDSTGSLSYAPAANQSGTATITVTVRDAGPDGVFDNADDATFSRSFAVTVNPVNDAPTLSGANVFTTIDENQTSGSGDLVSALIAGKVTDVDGPGSGIAITNLTSGTGTWQFSINGGSTWTTVGAVSGTSALLLRSTDRLRLVPNGQNGTSGSVTFRAWDQTTGSAGDFANANVNGGATAFSTATATSTITVTDVNDAPVLSGANNFTTIDEDQINGSGDLVSTLIAGKVTDVDTGAVNGIAITGLTSGTGIWQFSTNGGSTWTNVGTVSGTAALLLRSSDRLRLTPNGQNGTSGSVTFRGWDQTTGTAGNLANTSVSGGTTAFSTATATSTITVTSVNDSPVLTGANNFTSITNDQTSNSGDAVSALINGKITDVDGPGSGIAVTGITSGTGTWQYSINGGSTWNNLGAVSGTSALLLRSTDRLRLVPNGQIGATASVTFRAWDQTTGSAGSLVNTSVNGGTTAFSAATATSTITVADVNDAPVLSGANNFTTIDEDQINGSGDLVSTLIAGKVTDVDSGAISGIAVTSRTSGTGTWQFSTNGGSTWTNVAAVSGTSALLLRSTDRLRLVPNGQNGTSGSVTFRAWDQTTGSAGNLANTSVNGGTTAFSTATATATITVTSVNDSPVLSGANNFTPLNHTQTNNSGNSVSTLIASNDVDTGAVNGIAVTGLTSGTGIWQYSTNGGSTWIYVGLVSDTSALLLRSNDRLRFVPRDQYGTAGTVTFRAWDQTSGAFGTKVNISANGGSTAFSAAVGTSHVTVTGLNRSPILFGANDFTSISTHDTDVAGEWVSTLIAGKVADLDPGAVDGIAVTSVSSGTGIWQYSTDGWSWNNVEPVSGTSALLLRSNDRLRLLPDGQSSTLASVTFRAWDQTTGSAGSRVNVSANGGTTAFSTATATSEIWVTDSWAADDRYFVAKNESLVVTADGAWSNDIYNASWTVEDWGCIDEHDNQGDAYYDGYWDYGDWEGNWIWGYYALSGGFYPDALPEEYHPAGWHCHAEGTIYSTEYATGGIVENQGPAHGTFTWNVNGAQEFTYVPNPGFAGIDSFTYWLQDDQRYSTATVTIIVDSPPIASDNSYITDQNTPLVIGAPGVLGNDSDPENDALTAIFSNPAHGTVSGNSNGGFTYTPAPNFWGVDTFAYWAGDGYLGDIATVTVTVAPPLELTVNNASAVEGNPLQFLISLDEPALVPVTVRYSTASGTAVAPWDFESASGIATFEVGETTFPVNVTTIDDDWYESAQEEVGLVIWGADRATIVDYEGNGTIQEAEPAPEGSISITNFRSDGYSLYVDYDVVGAPAPFQISVYASPDGTATLEEPLEIGWGNNWEGSHTLWISPTFNDIQRDYYLMAKVDSANQVSETNENDNVMRFIGGSFIVHEANSGKWVLHVHAGDEQEAISVKTESGYLQVATRTQLSADLPTGSSPPPYYDYTADDQISQLDATMIGLALNHVTTKWHNPWWHLDVDNDGYVAPIDSLIVINHVNAFGQHQLNSPPGANSDFLDVNNDGWVTNADSLAVINYLNSSGPNTPSAPWRNPSSPQNIDGNTTLDQDDRWAIINYLDYNYGQIAGYSLYDRVAIRSHGGDDFVTTRMDFDTIPLWLFGGSGHDSLEGADGDDVLIGGAGDDALAGLGGSDLVQGDLGFDAAISGGHAGDQAYGEPGPSVNTLSLGNWTGDEPLQGSSTANFTVNLSLDHADTITVQYITYADSATAGDFTPTSGTLTFGPHVTSLPIPVSINHDLTDEGAESFYVDLLNPVGAMIGDGQGQGTIQPSDRPNLVINNVSANEGEPLIFLVKLSSASAQAVTVNYSTANGTATSGDYAPITSQVLTFEPNRLTKHILVNSLADALDEPNETVNVNLSSAANAVINDSQGIGTILDDDPLPTLTVDDVTISEGQGSATLTARLSTPSGRNVGVNWGAGSGLEHAATYFGDYPGAGGFFTIPAGLTSATFTVPLLPESAVEDDESFVVWFSSSLALVPDNSATVNIVNTDPPSPEPELELREGLWNSNVISHEVLFNWAHATSMEVIDFGKAQVGAPLTRTLTIFNDGAAPLQLNGISAPPAGFTVIGWPGGTIAPSTSASFTIQLHSATAGTYGGNISIFSNDPHESVFTFGLTGQVVGGDPSILVKDPTNVPFVNGVSYFDFGTYPQGQPVVFSFPLWNVGNPDLLITDIVLPPGFSLADSVPGDAWRVPYGGPNTLNIRFDGLSTSGSFGGPVYISSNDPDDGTFTFSISVQVTSEVSNAPVLSIGDWMGPDTEDATFTVTRAGDLSEVATVKYHINSYLGQARLGIDYSLVSGTLTFDPGEATQTITVPMKNDDFFENQEEFWVVLSQATNAEIGDPEAQGTILDQPAVSAVMLNLVNDDGASSSDRITSDSRLTGQITFLPTGHKATVEFDHDADGAIDGVVMLGDGDETFGYDPRAIQERLSGPVPLRYRLIVRDAEDNLSFTGSWRSWSIVILPAAGQGDVRISTLGLKSDTGSSNTDRVTVNPELFFVLAGNLAGGSAIVEIDQDETAGADGSVTVASISTEYYYDPRTVDPQFASAAGPVEIEYRLIQKNAAGQIVATGDWETYSYTIEMLPASAGTIEDLGLVIDDGASNEDGVSSDPTIEGKVAGLPEPPEGALELPLAQVQIDVGGNGTVDAVVNTDATGQFQYRPSLDEYGPVTIKARVKEWSADYGQYLYGATWTTLNFTYGVSAALTFDQIHLVNDTGPDEDDKITRDPTIAGVLLGDRVAYASIEWDFTGDTIADGSTYADEQGQFELLPRPLSATGPTTIRFRAGAYDSGSGQVLWGSWNDPFTFTYQAIGLPTIAELKLSDPLEDSGTPPHASNPHIQGQLTGGESDLAQLQIEFDHGLDGVADGAAIADADGSFNYLPQGLPAGNVTVRAHVIAWDPIQQALVAGPWTPVEFVYEPPVFAAATFDSITLARDTGSSTTDGITTDATLQGKVTAHGFGNTSAYLQIEFDHDGNATVDGATQTDASGNFRYVPVGLSLGARSLRARIREWNYLTRQGNVGAWSDPINFTLQAPQNLAPDVAMNLLVTTGTSGSTPVTTNSMLVGQVTNDQPGRIAVEFDHGNGGAAEGLAFTDESGFFHYQPQGLPLGAVTISARAVEWNHLTSQYQFGAPTTINFTYTSQPIAAAQIAALDLESPLAGSPTTTNSPVFVGRLVDSSFNQVLVVEVDTTGDGTPDQFTTADQLGNFRVQLNVAPGTHTISARPRKIHPATGQLLHGPSVSRSFTYEQAIDAVPILTGLGLKNDTGASNSDGQTTDPTLKGQATNDGAVAGLQVQFDYNDNDADGINGTTTTTADGQFSFLPAGLDLGQHTIRARIKEYTSSQTVQYSAWQSVQFTLLDARFGQARVDSLALANDDGNSTSDGATSDATITGHVSDGQPGTVVEIDTDNDGVADGTATTDADGNFEFQPDEVTDGLVTMRARVQGGEDDPADEWAATSFVVDSEPDGTQAQSLVAAFSSFSTLWQQARTTWQSALQTANDLLRSQTAISQSTYDTSIASAAALRQSTIDAARNTYNDILAGAENARGQALANAGSQLASNLSNFGGDTTSFVMHSFKWPEAPPDFGLETPSDSEQPAPPSDAPVYTGQSYDFTADALYQSDLAGIDYQYGLKLKQAQQTYDDSVRQAEEKFKNDLAAANNRYNQGTEAAIAARQQALSSGTNPINLVAITAQIRQQQKAIYDQLQRDHERAMREDAERHAAHWGQLLQERAEIEDQYRQLEQDIIDRHNNGTINDQQYWNELADLEVPWTTATANKDLELFLWDHERVRAYEEAYTNRVAAADLASAPLEVELMKKSAEWSHWEKENELKAEQVYDDKMAEAKKNLGVDSAEAARVRTRALADATKKLEVDKQKAEIDRWKGEALAQQRAMDAWYTFAQTPWTAYQKAIIDNGVEYITGIAPKVIERVETDAQKALEEVQTIADKQKHFNEQAAITEQTLTVDDNKSWKDFRIKVNNEDLDQAKRNADDWIKNYRITRAETKAFELRNAAAAEKSGKAQHRRVRDQSVELAEAEADWLRSGQTDLQTLETAERQVARDSVVRMATIFYEYTLDTTTAKETRGLAFSQAEKDLSTWYSTNKQSHDNAITTAYETYQTEAADHAATAFRANSSNNSQLVKDMKKADADANKGIAEMEAAIATEDATRQATWASKDSAAVKAYLQAVADQYAQQVSDWSASLDTAWSRYQLSLALAHKTSVHGATDKYASHSSTGATLLSTTLTKFAQNTLALERSSADQLKTEGDLLADAVATYAGKVADARKTYAQTLAADTATHDRDANAQTKLHSDNLAEEQRILTNGIDLAQWVFDRRNAELERDLTVAGADATLLTDPADQLAAVEQANADFTSGNHAAATLQRNTVLEKQRNYSVGTAAENKRWVAALGGLHVTLTENTKNNADTLASSLKTASDKLAQDYANAAKQLARDLAGGEKEAATKNADESKTFTSEHAKGDGALAIDLTAIANTARGEIASALGQYKTDLSQQRATALQNALNALPDGPMHDVATYQADLAQADLTWTQGISSSTHDFETDLSTAYHNQANRESGLAGYRVVETTTAAAADSSEVAGLASADDGRSTRSTENLEGLAEKIAAADAKLGRDQMKAEDQFDWDWGKAKRDFDNDVAQAELSRTQKTSLAELNYAQAVPIAADPSWYDTPEAIALDQTRDDAIAGAQAEYDADIRAAEASFAEKIAAAEVSRKEKYGDTFIARAAEESNARTIYVSAENSNETTYESAVTQTETAKARSFSEAIRDFKIAVARSFKSTVIELGDAKTSLAQDLRTTNVQFASNVATAQGSYQLAASQRAATQAQTAASAAPGDMQLAFDAAYATAQANWVSAMQPAFTAFTSAMADAEQAQQVQITQAVAAFDTGRATADVTFAENVEPLIATSAVNTAAIEGGLAEANATRRNVHFTSLTDANSTFLGSAASALRQKVVDDAMANQTYWIDLANLAPGSSDAPIVKARDLGYANASLSQITGVANARTLWTTNLFDAERILGETTATNWKNAKTEVAAERRDLAIDMAPFAETRSNSYASVQTDYWTAIINAATARRMAEAIAEADYRTADYAQAATAMASINTTMSLPWTAYQAELVVAEGNWWTTSERGNFLTLIGNLNAAEQSYQTEVNSEYLSSAANSAAADRAFVEGTVDYPGAAAFEYAWRAADYASDEAYAHALAQSDEAWQIANASDDGIYQVALATNYRNWVDDSDDEAHQAANAAAAAAFETSGASNELGYTIDESAAASNMSARAEHRRTYIQNFNVAAQHLVQAKTSADKGSRDAEAEAAAARAAAIAIATAEHDVLASRSLADALAVLAAQNGSPWAAYDAAVADAQADYWELVAPAERDLAIAEADAEKVFAQSSSSEIELLSRSLAEKSRDWNFNVATADRDRALSELIAEQGAAPTLPISAMRAFENANREPGSEDDGESNGGGTGSTWPMPAAEADQPVPGSPERPQGPPPPPAPPENDFPIIIPVSPIGPNPDPRSTVALPLPNELAPAGGPAFFSRGRLLLHELPDQADQIVDETAHEQNIAIVVVRNSGLGAGGLVVLRYPTPRYLTRMVTIDPQAVDMQAELRRVLTPLDPTARAQAWETVLEIRDTQFLPASRNPLGAFRIGGNKMLLIDEAKLLAAGARIIENDRIARNVRVLVPPHMRPRAVKWESVQLRPGFVEAIRSYADGGPPGGPYGKWTRPIQLLRGGEQEVLIEGVVPLSAVKDRVVLARTGQILNVPLKGLGLVGTAGDIVDTGYTVIEAYEESNQTHSSRPLIVAFSSQGGKWAGGWAGAQAGGALGAALGWETGPGVIIFVLVGSAAGAMGGERAFAEVGNAAADGVETIANAHEFAQDPVGIVAKAKEGVETFMPPPENSWWRKFFSIFEILRFPNSGGLNFNRP